MKIIAPLSLMSVSAGALAACAGASNSAPPSPPTAVASAAPEASSGDSALVSEDARTRFFDAIAHNDEASAMKMLGATPALANTRSARGTSAYFAALGRQVDNGFIRPEDNALARAILAHHPELDLFESAAAGDLARVDAELTRDPSVLRKVQERLGWTPLHFAAFGGQARIVTLLVDRGAEVDAVAKNAFANTPLQVALLTRQGEVAALLLSRGANVRFRSAEGVTALHEAAQSGDVDTVRLLLDAGADPIARTGKIDEGKEGLTPLDLARKAGRTEVVALLEGRASPPR